MSLEQPQLSEIEKENFKGMQSNGSRLGKRDNPEKPKRNPELICIDLRDRPHITHVILSVKDIVRFSRVISTSLALYQACVFLLEFSLLLNRLREHADLIF